MSSLLFDLTASQPSAAIKRHGGGVYIQTATLVIRDSLLNVYPDACKKCHVGDSPLRLWASLNGKVRYFLFAGGWTSRQKKKPIKKLLPGWKSEIDMLDYLDFYSQNVYTKAFHRRKEIYLYSLLKTHKKILAVHTKEYQYREKDSSSKYRTFLYMVRMGIYCTFISFTNTKKISNQLYIHCLS